MLEVWKKWDAVHSEPDQQKRISSAKKAENTPLSIDKSAGVGMFSGSHGIYNTTLETCGCGDYIRRNKPCKHIYRLAIECGLVAVGAVCSDIKAVKAPALTSAERKQALLNVIALFETYSDEIQNEIREMIYCTNTGKMCSCENTDKLNKVIADGLIEIFRDDEQALRAHAQKLTLEKLEAVGFKFPEDLKNTKKARFEWCLTHAATVAPLAYPNFAFIRPAGLLNVAKKKAYTYLLRKYADDNIMDENGGFHSIPHGAECSVLVSESGVSKLVVQFPDDEITDLLNKYNANRCAGLKL